MFLCRVSVSDAAISVHLSLLILSSLRSSPVSSNPRDPSQPAPSYPRLSPPSQNNSITSGSDHLPRSLSTNFNRSAGRLYAVHSPVQVSSVLFTCEDPPLGSFFSSIHPQQTFIYLCHSSFVRHRPPSAWYSHVPTAPLMITRSLSVQSCPTHTCQRVSTRIILMDRSLPVVCLCLSSVYNRSRL